MYPWYSSSLCRLIACYGRSSRWHLGPHRLRTCINQAIFSFHTRPRISYSFKRERGDALVDPHCRMAETKFCAQHLARSPTHSFMTGLPNHRCLKSLTSCLRRLLHHTSKLNTPKPREFWPSVERPHYGLTRVDKVGVLFITQGTQLP